MVSETTFKGSKRYSISKKLKSKCLQDIESLFGKVYTKEVKKESALAECKGDEKFIFSPRFGNKLGENLCQI